MIDCSPLWITMEKRNISQYYLVNNGIDYRTMQQLRNNQNITASTIEKLCRILSCTPNDILTFTDDDIHDKYLSEPMHPAVLFCSIAVLRCCGLDTKHLQNSIISPYLLDIAVIFDITVNQHSTTTHQFHFIV